MNCLSRFNILSVKAKCYEKIILVTPFKHNSETLTIEHYYNSEKFEHNV